MGGAFTGNLLDDGLTWVTDALDLFMIDERLSGMWYLGWAIYRRYPIQLIL